MMGKGGYYGLEVSEITAGFEHLYDSSFREYGLCFLPQNPLTAHFYVKI